jgi:hypothetical protein
MPTTESMPTIPVDLRADLREALANLGRGVRDLEAARQACARMDRLREANRQRLGEQAIAVELIRETRAQP